MVAEYWDDKGAYEWSVTATAVMGKASIVLLHTHDAPVGQTSMAGASFSLTSDCGNLSTVL